MKDFSDFMLFHELVESGSLTEAQKRLGIPKSTLSRRLKALEQTYGVSLLKRSTRRQSLTPEGELIWTRLKELKENFLEIESTLLKATTEVQGRIRITCPVDVGLRFLSPLIASFQKRFPYVEIEVELNDRKVDLIQEGVDLALRAGPLTDSRLISKKLAEFEFGLFASPSLVAEKGAVTHPKQLETWPGLFFRPGRENTEWILQKDRQKFPLKTQIRTWVNSFQMARDLADQSLGLTLLPDFLCEARVQQGHLVRLLPDWSGGRRRLHALFLPGPQALRIRLFLDHLSQNWGEEAPSTRNLKA